MEHQEMIEVLEKEIEIARLSERVCQASPKRVKALTQVIALAKRVADVEGVKKGLHVFFDDNTTWQHIDFADDFPRERIINQLIKELANSVSQYLIKG